MNDELKALLAKDDLTEAEIDRRDDLVGHEFRDVDNVEMGLEILRLRAEIENIRFAAHMPADYPYGLPSWINQHLYAATLVLFDHNGRRISLSEDVEQIVHQQHVIGQLRDALTDLATWWENWMPDAAYGQGGHDALLKARAALGLKASGGSR